MAFDINGFLGTHPAALQLGADRTELIARNLANANTPNYKARDIDFRSAMAAAGTRGAPLAMTATSPGHLGTASAAGASDPSARADLKYRVPLAPALDGNTVDPQLEQAAFAENTVRYQATLTFLGAKFKGLMTAITGS
jgi:flagellar basal-body rod protein FlgB